MQGAAQPLQLPTSLSGRGGNPGAGPAGQALGVSGVDGRSPLQAAQQRDLQGSNTGDRSSTAVTQTPLQLLLAHLANTELAVQAASGAPANVPRAPPHVDVRPGPHAQEPPTWQANPTFQGEPSAAVAGGEQAVQLPVDQAAVVVNAPAAALGLAASGASGSGTAQAQQHQQGEEGAGGPAAAATAAADPPATAGAAAAQAGGGAGADAAEGTQLAAAQPRGATAAAGPQGRGRAMAQHGYQGGGPYRIVLWSYVNTLQGHEGFEGDLQNAYTYNDQLADRDFRASQFTFVHAIKTQAAKFDTDCLWEWIHKLASPPGTPEGERVKCLEQWVLDHRAAYDASTPEQRDKLGPYEGQALLIRVGTSTRMRSLSRYVVDQLYLWGGYQDAAAATKLEKLQQAAGHPLPNYLQDSLKLYETTGGEEGECSRTFLNYLVKGIVNRELKDKAVYELAKLKANRNDRRHIPYAVLQPKLLKLYKGACEAYELDHEYRTHPDQPTKEDQMAILTRQLEELRASTSERGTQEVGRGSHGEGRASGGGRGRGGEHEGRGGHGGGSGSDEDRGSGEVRGHGEGRGSSGASSRRGQDVRRGQGGAAAVVAVAATSAAEAAAAAAVEANTEHMREIRDMLAAFTVQHGLMAPGVVSNKLQPQQRPQVLVPHRQLQPPPGSVEARLSAVEGSLSAMQGDLTDFKGLFLRWLSGQPQRQTPPQQQRLPMGSQQQYQAAPAPQQRQQQPPPPPPPP